MMTIRYLVKNREIERLCKKLLRDWSTLRKAGRPYCKSCGEPPNKPPNEPPNESPNKSPDKPSDTTVAKSCKSPTETDTQMENAQLPNPTYLSCSPPPPLPIPPWSCPYPMTPPPFCESPCCFPPYCSPFGPTPTCYPPPTCTFCAPENVQPPSNPCGQSCPSCGSSTPCSCGSKPSALPGYSMAHPLSSAPLLCEPPCPNKDFFNACRRVCPPPCCTPGPIPPNPCCPVPPAKCGGYLKYKRIFFCIFPFIILLSLNALAHDDPCPKEPCREFEYMRRRTKRFPWGTGQESFFHNEHVNHLPDECQPPPLVCVDQPPYGKCKKKG